nr:hypothetical protein [Tanacetum cinerariifolium]
TRDVCLSWGEVEKGSANAMEVEKRTAGKSGLNATVLVKRGRRGYLEHVAEYQHYLDEEHNKAEEEEAVTESPNATKVTKPKAAKQTKPSAPKVHKVTKPTDDKTPKPTSSQPPKPTPAPTKPSKKDQEKVINEQAAHDLLNLQTLKKKSLADQFVFHRHTLMPTEPSGHAESPSLDEEVPGINDGYQDEGQAGPNLGDAVES